MPNFSPSGSRAASAEIADDATGLSTKIVVISLPDATERRAAFAARAGGVGLDWSFIDAGRGLGPNLTYDPDEAIVSKGRPLSPGELGCYASHYASLDEVPRVQDVPVGSAPRTIPSLIGRFWKKSRAD